MLCTRTGSDRLPRKRTTWGKTHPEPFALGVLWPDLQLLLHPHDKHVRQAAPLVHVVAVGLLAAGKGEGTDQRLLQARNTGEGHEDSANSAR